MTRARRVPVHKKALLVEGARRCLPLENSNPAEANGYVRLPWRSGYAGPLPGRADGASVSADPAPPLAAYLHPRGVRSVWTDFLAGKTVWSRPWSLYGPQRLVPPADPRRIKRTFPAEFSTTNREMNILGIMRTTGTLRRACLRLAADRLRGNPPHFTRLSVPPLDRGDQPAVRRIAAERSRGTQLIPRIFILSIWSVYLILSLSARCSAAPLFEALQGPGRDQLFSRQENLPDGANAPRCSTRQRRCRVREACIHPRAHRPA